ncbi:MULTISPECIES: AMP-binding protein [Arsenicicoccus]|uniref:AMP-binding protein n=1 Tax=Arsenicicoccus TaxID=267408 RepID=UPI000420E292|nr:MULTISPECIES: AMP-binding protein [Arsenicicoccus]
MSESVWTELSESDVDDGVLPRFRRVTSTRPDAVAVSDEDTSLTYGQVAARAAGVLRGIRQALDALDPPPARHGEDAFGAAATVAMCCDHTVDAVVTLLAVVASGHPVLVLDPRTPGPRQAQLVERAGARLLVTDPANERLASELHVVPLSVRGLEPADPQILWGDPPSPTSVAALAFTSGSTGTPKPVANDHRLLVRDAWNSSIATGCYSSADTIAHTLPIAFHAGLTTTLHGLLVGARMRLYDARSRGIAGLPAVIAEHGCTLMITSPAILRGFVATAPDPAMLATLRSLTVAGEASYGRDVEAVRPLLPAGCLVRNRYGSSETGLIAEYVVGPEHPPLDGPLPAGRGVGRTVLSVMDEHGTPAAPWATGRLVVTAPQVATGYWQLPEATAEAFADLADGTRRYRTSDLGRVLPDGAIQIVGRADHSVKVRGYLVDPGEVDAALFTLDDVREAVVVSGPRPGDGRTRLVAYVVHRRLPAPPTGAGLPGAELPDPGLEAAWRQALRGQLPAHMIPEAFVLVGALPRNDRGKIDRAALPEAPERELSGAHTSRWEALVAEQWAAALEHDGPLRPDSDFFALGGDSLAAEALMARLVSELGVDPDRARTTVLAQAPVLADFAEAVRGTGAGPDHCLVPLVTGAGAGPAGAAEGAEAAANDAGCRPAERPVFLLAGAGGIGIALRPIALRLGGRPAYALQNPVLEARGLPDLTLRRLARRYVKVVRRVQPEGPYLLAGHSFGGLVAFEMCHQLRAVGQDARLAIIDSFPPEPSLHPEPEEGTSPPARARSLVRLVRASLRDTTGATDAWRFFLQSDALARAYRSQPWPGETLVLVAQSPEKDARSRWAPHLIGPHHQVEISGDHFTLLREPWAEEVAAHLRTFFGEPAAST